MPLLAGTVVMVLAVVVSLAVGRANLETAKESRVDDRTALVERFAATGSAGYGRLLTERLEDGAPFSPVDTDWNVTLLDTVGLGPTGQALIGATVIDADGRSVGATPADLVIPAEILDEFLDIAIDEGTVVSNVFELDGEPVWGVFNAVGGDDVWGALVMVEPLRDGWLQEIYQAMGAVNSPDGGLTTVDRRGVVSASWDQDRIGLPFEEVPPAGATSAVVSERVVNGETFVRIAMARGDDPSILIFEQREASLFADLVRAQNQRDRLVVAAAVVATFLLVGFASWRHRAVRRSEDRTNELLGHARDVVAVVDRDGIVRFVSPAVRNLLGHDPEMIVGATLDDLLSEKSASATREGLARAIDEGASSVLGVQARHANGTRLWFDLHLMNRPHPDIDGVLVTCHEVGDRRELERTLHERARHDALTQLGNRLTFDEALRAAASEDGRVAVMMIDLDHFKPLNDSLGHDAGDAALRMVARAMARQVRQGDVVCRLGGDEFGVIAPGIDLDAASHLAQRLVDRITEGWTATDSTIPLGASAGVAVGNGPMDRPEQLLREADSAMYRAKLDGGGRVVAVEVAAVPVEASSISITHHEESADTPRPDRALVTTPAIGPSGNTTSRAGTASRRRLQNTATWLLTAAIIVGLVLGGAHLNGERIEELEDERIANRTQLTRTISENVSGLVDLSALPEMAASGTWPIEEAPEFVEFVLGRWANSGVIGDDPLAAVTDREGNVLVSYPADLQLAIGPDDPDWQSALDGRPLMSNVVDDGEGPRIYYVIPLRIDGTVDHALVLGADPRETTWSKSFASLGALTPGPGGLSTVDDRGVAYSSWDPSAVGQQLVEPALLADIASDEIYIARNAGEQHDQVMIIQQVPGSHRPSYLVWSQSRAAMFGDLRAGQSVRDIALFAVVLVALAGLTVVNHRREVLLRRSERLTDAMLQQAHDVVIVTDPDLTVRFVSDAASRHLGIDRAAGIGAPLAALLGAAPARRIAERLAEARPGQAVSIDRVSIAAQDGDLLEFDIDIADLRRHRSIAGYLLTCHETSDRARLEALLAAQADSDPLTGLANRAHFGSRLDQLAERRTHQAGADAVVFIDLDHFKPVNDEFGHQAGDHLLQVLARRLEATVRETDIVCRLGGDEFALLLTDCDLETAEATVERLLHAIREPVSLPEGVVALDASIGLALSRSEVTNPEQLVREADQAMYAAKRAGRGRYVVER